LKATEFADASDTQESYYVRFEVLTAVLFKISSLLGYDAIQTGMQVCISAYTVSIIRSISFTPAVPFLKGSIVIVPINNTTQSHKISQNQEESDPSTILHWC
jgi:hypothetical protein